MPRRQFPRNPAIRTVICGSAMLAVVAAGITSPAWAEDHGHGKKRYYRGSGQAYEGSGAVGLPTRIPGIGTYAGALAGERFRGNGNYFYYQGSGGYIPVPVPATPARQPQGLKIIDVGKDTSAGDCDEESGVCIIRP